MPAAHHTHAFCLQNFAHLHPGLCESTLRSNTPIPNSFPPDLLLCMEDVGAPIRARLLSLGLRWYDRPLCAHYLIEANFLNDHSPHITTPLTNDECLTCA